MTISSPQAVTGKRRILGTAAGGGSLGAGLGALVLAGIPLAMINQPDTAGKIAGSIFGALFSVSGIIAGAIGLIAGCIGFFAGTFSSRVLSAAGLTASGFGLQLSIHLLDRIT